MSHKICRCCGLSLTIARGVNPNLCRDCEQFVWDESPMIAAHASRAGDELGGVQLQPVEDTGDSGAEPVLDFGELFSSNR
jgi:hypothetical protein